MHLSYQEVLQYQKDGYVIVENVFNEAEVQKLIQEIEGGKRVAESVNIRKDASGKTTKLAIWHELGEDIWSAASTHPRIVNNVRILLGEDAAFFHGKVMLKEAKTGGAWEWHQDYGYWYEQGFLLPNMMSAFVALDAATIENGCLRVLKGSHHLGRLNHGRVGTQTGVDPERLKQIESLFESVSCEMKAGSVLFFHGNLLHSSSANESEHHRRSFISCYSATSNKQIVDGRLIELPSCPVGLENAILSQ